MTVSRRKSKTNLFDLVLIWIPDYANEFDGLKFALQLPFAPGEGLLIELDDEYFHQTTMPRLGSVIWNVRKQSFYSFIKFEPDGIDGEEFERRTHKRLLQNGWTEM